MDSSKIHKIVLTGGPCGGKTAALAHIKSKLSSDGYRVYTVPESATILLAGGCSIVNLTEDQMTDFQMNLMLLQQALEDHFVAIAQSAGVPSIVICDRGMMDGYAYVPTHVWHRILDKADWVVDDLYKRYDAVIHLVTAADGAEEHYSSASNPVRWENAEQARDHDTKLILAWVGHPKLSIIDNGTTFDRKLDRVSNAVKRIIGI